MSKSPKISVTQPLKARLNEQETASIRALLSLLRQKITEQVEKDPRKSAVILAEWVQRPVNRKSAA